ncbi:MAG TPA: Co2+/Mg2+ efflux protein ApaG [Saprospiraceae bacterium]|nr:Co2+/Mg2+ efflux protein ApaG [Saprospiraceae bacterium]
MPILVTKGVEIKVVTSFSVRDSDIMGEQFVFRYTVRITNRNSFAIKLLKRRWQIFDSLGMMNIVHGDGVIGQNPIIEPGASYEYSSWSRIKSEIGEMQGAYLMEKDSGDTFWVDIPIFELIYPGKLN